MQKKLLVTGGAGFIGANFVHYWLREHPDDLLVCLDALTYAGNRKSLAAIESQENFIFQQGNILDENLISRLMKEYAIDNIVHFAAESHVDRSITGPDAFLETNVSGTHALLKIAKQQWLDAGDGVDHRFHHISTDEVYGTLERSDPAFTEQTAYAPNSPYSASKAASDFMVRAYHHTYGMNVTTSNCSNNYGPFHFPEKLIPLVITNILRNRPLPVYGDGKQIRDWLYVEDHARAIDMVLENGAPGETYNVGGSNELENIAIVKMICRKVEAELSASYELSSKFSQASLALSGRAAELIEYVDDRLGHDRRYAIDARKIERELGFRPYETFESGISRTVRWFLDCSYWWRNIV